MAIDTQSASAITRSRKLKSPTEPSIMPSTVEMLTAKKDELAQLRAKHRTVVEDQIVAEGGWKNGVQQRPNNQEAARLKAENARMADATDRLDGEITVLHEMVRAERAESPEVKTEADELVRQRALAVIALRKCNLAIDRLTKSGAHIPVGTAVTAFGMCPYGSMLLGHADAEGITGRAARGYISEVFNAGLISRGEMEG